MLKYKHYKYNERENEILADEESILKNYKTNFIKSLEMHKFCELSTSFFASGAKAYNRYLELQKIYAKTEKNSRNKSSYAIKTATLEAEKFLALFENLDSKITSKNVYDLNEIAKFCAQIPGPLIPNSTPFKILKRVFELAGKTKLSDYLVKNPNPLFWKTTGNKISAIAIITNLLWSFQRFGNIKLTEKSRDIFYNLQRTCYLLIEKLKASGIKPNYQQKNQILQFHAYLEYLAKINKVTEKKALFHPDFSMLVHTIKKDKLYNQELMDERVQTLYDLGLYTYYTKKEDIINSKIIDEKDKFYHLNMLRGHKAKPKLITQREISDTLFSIQYPPPNVKQSFKIDVQDEYLLPGTKMNVDFFVNVKNYSKKYPGFLLGEYNFLIEVDGPHHYTNEKECEDIRELNPTHKTKFRNTRLNNVEGYNLIIIPTSTWKKYKTNYEKINFLKNTVISLFKENIRDAHDKNPKVIHNLNDNELFARHVYSENQLAKFEINEKESNSTISDMRAQQHNKPIIFSRKKMKKPLQQTSSINTNQKKKKKKKKKKKIQIFTNNILF